MAHLRRDGRDAYRSASPTKSAALRVPVRMSVSTTSAGILTSAAPLSSTKFNVILLLVETGTVNVPPSICSRPKEMLGQLLVHGREHILKHVRRRLRASSIR